MSDKSRDMLKIVVGAYLVWLGFDLGRSALTNRPDNYIVFLICGVAFVVVGLLIAVTSAKRRLNPDSYDEEVEDEEEEITENEVIAEDEEDAKDVIEEEHKTEEVVEDDAETKE